MDRKETYQPLVLSWVYNFSEALAGNPTSNCCSAGFFYQIPWPDTTILVFSWTYARSNAFRNHSGG